MWLGGGVYRGLKDARLQKTVMHCSNRQYGHPCITAFRKALSDNRFLLLGLR
jgi:hypothetical protein